MCKERYINPFTDFGFKRLFGTTENKHLLIRILNDFLDCRDPIEDVTYINPEKLGISSTHRKAIYDIYCLTKSGAHIIVEMQNMHQEFFMDRSIYYSTFPMQEAAKKGEWDFNLPPVYTVVFLNFRMDQFMDDPDPKHVAKICNVKNGRVLYNKLTYVYIEMPKVVKPLEQLETPEEKWLWSIKNMNQLDEYPEELRDEIYRELFDISEIQAFTKEERMAYEESLKNMRDWQNILSTAVKEGRKEGRAEGREEGRAEGREEGRAEGREEGRAEERRSMVRQMLTAGLPIEQIVKITGLPVEEIEWTQE